MNRLVNPNDIKLQSEDEIQAKLIIENLISDQGYFCFRNINDIYEALSYLFHENNENIRWSGQFSTELYQSFELEAVSNAKYSSKIIVKIFKHYTYGQTEVYSVYTRLSKTSYHSCIYPFI